MLRSQTSILASGLRYAQQTSPFLNNNQFILSSRLIHSSSAVTNK